MKDFVEYTVKDRAMKELMHKNVRQPIADPLSLIPRIVSRLYSIWLKSTYPFQAVGEGFWAHYSCDIRRPMAPYIRIGNSVWLDREVWLNVPTVPEGNEPAIEIEDGCKIGRRCMISAKNRVHVGHECIFGPSVLITDHLHGFEDITIPIQKQGVTEGGTVKIESGCWLGFGAVIVSSRGELVIGRNSIVGANAVVTRNIPPYSVVVGNPAKVVKQYDPDIREWVLGSKRNVADRVAK